MSKMPTKKYMRYLGLRANWFTYREARMLSTIPKGSPAMKAMVEDRVKKRNNFEKLAAAKISSGKWKRSEVVAKWKQSLSRLYTRRGWRVQGTPAGKQPKIAKGSPNPFAMYRSYIKTHPGPRHVSPWELRQIARGKTKLQKGLLFVQVVEKEHKKGTVSDTTIRRWIADKDYAIKHSSGERKVRLVLERNRLQKVLTR